MRISLGALLKVVMTLSFVGYYNPPSPYVLNSITGHHPNFYLAILVLGVQTYLSSIFLPSPMTREARRGMIQRLSPHLLGPVTPHLVCP